MHHMEPTTPLVRSAARCVPAVVLAAVVALLGAPGAAAQEAPTGADTPAAVVGEAPAPEITAAAGVLIDATTAQVIWEHNAHEPVNVASTTKMLTALVAEDAYASGESLTVPEEAPLVDGSRIGLETGQEFARDDLLAALLLASGNDVAEVFAANYPDGREAFLGAMQTTCELLGCTDSTWRDPAGLDAPGHLASAADLAIVGRALLTRPLLAEYVAAPTWEFTWPDGRVQVISNGNKMVRLGDDPGTVGLKTGFTTVSGHTLAAAQRRGDRTLIAVVLDTPDHYAAARELFDYGFAAEVPADAEVLGVTADEVAASVAADEQPAAAAEVAEESPWGLDGLPVPLVVGGLSVLLVTAGLIAIAGARRSRSG
jgi:D-alanyl-D-alanine carboxypeptidase (penicillin-binding protein 5/6)